MPSFQQYEEGNYLRGTLKDSVTGAVISLADFTTAELRFIRPGGSTFTRAVTKETDGTDGRFYIQWESTNLSAYGSYRVQFHGQKPGRVVNSKWNTFYVNEASA